MPGSVLVFYRSRFAYRRWRHREAATRTVLAPLYEQTAVDTRSSVDDVRYLVIDCEMTGLDARCDHILSIGWVQIEKGRILHASRKRMLIHSERATGRGSTIHGLTNPDLADAEGLRSAMDDLVSQMPGCVLVMHHALLDLAFLQRASLSLYACPLLFSYLDTMEIEAASQHSHEAPAGLRLAECRQRYGLPVVSQHDALADAEATAELLLAQLVHRRTQRGLTLNDLPLHST